MALIGKKKPAARPVFDEPAPTIDAAAPQVDASVGDVSQGVPKIKHGIFGSGITGKDVLRTAGDILQFGPFAPLARERINNYREDRKVDNAYKLALAQKAFEPDESYEDVRDAEGNLIGQRARRSGKYDPITANDGRTALQQNWDWFNGLSPADQQRARLMMPGAAYDLGVQQPIIAARTAAQVEAKASPTYAATHPKPAGGPGGPRKVQATRVVNGRAFYKVNGEWYDNPEGR